MKPSEFNSLLLKRFPEIQDEFNDYTSWQDGIDTGSTLVIEDIFVKYLWKSLDNKNLGAIKRIFDFAEDILNQGDEYACNVITVSFLEAIKSDERNETVLPYLLPRSKTEYDSITL